MRQVFWLRFLLLPALILGISAPASVIAAGFDGSALMQSQSADPGNAAAVAGLAEVARIVRPLKGEVTSATASTDGVVEALTPTPEPTPMVADEVEPTATPEEETPQVDATATPEAEEEAPPAVDSTFAALVQHSNEGVIVQAPSDWVVEPGDFGTIFNLEIPDTEFIGFVQPMSAEEFPGLLGMVLFQTQADALVAAIDPSAELIAVTALTTGQELPIAKIALSISAEDGAGEGAIYMVSPGTDTYALYAFAAPDVWAEVEGAVDLMAESMFFDPTLLTLTTAEGGPLEYTDEASGLSLVLPETWQIAPTGDEDLPVIIADADLQFAGILGIAPGTPEEEGLDLDALLQGQGAEVDAETAADLVQTLLELMNISSEEFVQDEALTQVSVEEGTALVRFGGEASFDEMSGIPMIFYLLLTPDRVTALILMGDAEQALSQEPAIVQLMGTVEK